MELESPRDLRIGASSQTFSDLAFPRFEFESHLKLAEPTTSKRLALSDVIHRAVVRVDETGTKAAAATAVVATTTSADPEPSVLSIDRPFVFFIVDDATGPLAFAGIVEHPLE